MFKLVKKQAIRPITLREHHLRRNSVLVRRRVGGYGDILMQRMMWQDFSEQNPELEFTFACPSQYYGFASRHPFIKTRTLDDTDERNYGIVYDITTACRVHESRAGDRNDKHRSDIWANFCGIELRRHGMHLSVEADCRRATQTELLRANPDGRPVVLFAPRSTACDFGTAKSLTDRQIGEVATALRDMGLFVLGVHNCAIEPLERAGVTQFVNMPADKWIATTDLADYVISVDTSTFHLAGGLGKKLVGIFTFTDGKVYGKYYDFVLVQRHRDNGDWECGPCFCCHLCPKSRETVKPCLTELRASEIIDALKRLL